MDEHFSYNILLPLIFLLFPPPSLPSPVLLFSSPYLHVPPSLPAAPLDSMLHSLVIAAHGRYGNQGTINVAMSLHLTNWRCAYMSICVCVCMCVCAYNMCRSFLPLTVFVPHFVFAPCLHRSSPSIPSPPSPGQQLHDSTDSNKEQVMIYRCLRAGEMGALTKKCLGFTVCVSPPRLLMYSMLQKRFSINGPFNGHSFHEHGAGTR